MKTGSEPGTVAQAVASAEHALGYARAKFCLGELPGSTLFLEQAARHLQEALCLLGECRADKEERRLLLAAIERFRVALRHAEAMNSQAACFDSGWAKRLAEALGVESGSAYGPGRQDGLAAASSRIQLEA